MINSRYVFVAIVCFCATTAVAETPDRKQPNVVFLLADDLGWTGLGCFGSDFYETPNLDRLAQKGMKFTNAYAACTVCSPTRASILTGCTQQGCTARILSLDKIDRTQKC